MTAMPFNRLHRAADATLEAIRWWEKVHSHKSPWPPDMMEQEEEPICLHDFTRQEIEEASWYLVRLGYIVIARKKEKGK
jgi:hypothetical protein